MQRESYALYSQESFVNQDPCSLNITETENYIFSHDAWHYISDGHIKMGIAFAKAMNSLNDICA